MKSANPSVSQSAGVMDFSSLPMFKLLGAVLIAVGVLARLSPLIDPEGRLFWQYMTEDGYLMQTIARNMAIGLGMTTAEGTISTNGVQPLATFLFAGLHFLGGGSKSVGIALVMIFSTIVSAAAAYFLYRTAAIVLTAWSNGRAVAFMVAALWFSAPLIIPTTMNGLETSLYLLTVLATTFYYLSCTSRSDPTLGWRERVVLGLLLGLTFLSRNDAVFFIAILLLVHLLMGGASAGGYGRRFIDCFIAGILSIAIASPWLIYNYHLFGSIVPISGTAQSHAAAIGSNLHLIPAKLFEAATLYAPLPGHIEDHPLVVVVSLSVLSFSLYLFWRTVAKQAIPARRFLYIGGGMLLALVSYYGLFFGAPHFLARYLSVLSPFLWLATAVSALHLAVAIFGRQAATTRLTAVAVAVLTVMSAGFAIQSFSQGTTHMHKQVVDWVAANVPANAWVGAPQTGTLGYFHDRTLNLDGKVNPGALRALLEDGHILDYALDSQIDYVVDWVGMADWVNHDHLSPEFGQSFEVVVRDEEKNLGALRRRILRGG